MLPGSSRKTNPLALPPFGRIEDERGMSYGMSYYETVMPAPNVSPLQRQSLGQPVLRHKLQNSHYQLRVPYSWTAKMQLNYPWFKGSAIVQTNSTQSTVQTPNVQKRSFFTPGTAAGGSMRPMARFSKALPLPINTYQVGVY